MPSKVHDRVVEVIAFLRADPRPTGCRKPTGSKKTIGEFVLAIVELYTKLLILCASFVCIACVNVVRCTGRHQAKANRITHFN